LTNGEVNYDWPFYPKGEATIVRKSVFSAFFSSFHLIYFILEKSKNFKLIQLDQQLLKQQQQLMLVVHFISQKLFGD
jgi:hypothetical protein